MMMLLQHLRVDGDAAMVQQSRKIIKLLIIAIFFDLFTKTSCEELKCDEKRFLLLL
jgi:hypothetical protein